MVKRVIIMLLATFILLSFTVIAQNSSNISQANQQRNTNTNVEKNSDKSYQCLKDLIDKKITEDISLEEAVFSTLALGSQKKLSDAIQNKKGKESCWPKSSCDIKETAQVALAYNWAGKSTKEIESWLASKSKPSTELTWYLEIDIQGHTSSECILKYDSFEKNIKINDKMQLEGDPGSCFAISYGGYWLQIRDRCLDKEFEISCNNDFISTLAYEKNTGGTVFISSETHSSASLGTTTEKVDSKCFGTSNRCDYEGTLWTTLVLEKTNNDISAYIPYLLALSSDNQKYFPAVFLYILTKGDDHYQEIIQKQKVNSYWDIIGSPNNRFFDASLAMLALSGTGSSELESAQSYLLGIQTKDGCWNNNNIRDTAFILFSGFPRQLSDTGVTGEALCESSGNFCISGSHEDCLQAEGTVYNDKLCKTFSSVCCSVNIKEQTCAEKGGLICASNQECSGGIIETSADGSCCLNGACINKKPENICETITDGECRSECFDDEKETTDTCANSEEVCCKPEEKPDDKENGISSLWIVILLILILLLILAIIYRNRIIIWWHQRKSGKSAQSRMPPRFPPMLPPARYAPLGLRLPARPAPQTRLVKPARSSQDKEIEETMRKLKEMSK